MGVRVSEIADGIFKLSTLVPEIAPPAGFTFNQYLLVADEPLLFHTGPRHMFEPILAAVQGILPIASLRWVSFGHVESDECGSMNKWLEAAPRAQIIHGATACLVSLNDLADRAPRMLADGEVLDLGGKRVRWIDTPHVPHGWESGLMYEEITGTLLCGDLFTHVGDAGPVVRESIIPRAIQAEEMFKATSLTPQTGPTIRRLAQLKPKVLAVMHGSCFEGDCADQLMQLATYYENSIRSEVAV